MRQWIAPTLVSLFLISACGGGSSPHAIPAAASKMDTELKARMVRFVPMISNIETSLVFVLNTGLPGTEDMTVALDTSPGAAPYTYVFSGAYDGNGDGFNETTMSGHTTFNSDPTMFEWSGLSGQATTDVSIPLLGHVYHSEVAFTIQSEERQISGSGTFTEPITGNTITMTVSAASPLVIKTADGTADAVSNACGYSMNGQMRLDVTSSDGTLISYWNFDSTSPNVAVNDASFTDTSGHTTTLPNSSVSLACGSGGSINDWVGTFDHYWACLPFESGQALITITVSGPDTLSVIQDGSGEIYNYEATIVGANTYAATGYFIGGPDGFHYREDFKWTLRKNDSSFSQVSHYQFIEGPSIVKGGICVSTDKRVP